MGDVEKKLVQVIVPPRDNGHDGWYAAGRQWRTGTHEAELTDTEIANLSSRPGIVVLLDGKPVREGQVVPQKLTALTPDEETALAAYRASKASSEKPPAAPPVVEQGQPEAEGEPTTVMNPQRTVLGAPSSKEGKRR